MTRGGDTLPVARGKGLQNNVQQMIFDYGKDLQDNAPQRRERG